MIGFEPKVDLAEGLEKNNRLGAEELCLRNQTSIERCASE